MTKSKKTITLCFAIVGFAASILGVIFLLLNTVAIYESWEHIHTGLAVLCLLAGIGSMVLFRKVAKADEIEREEREKARKEDAEIFKFATQTLYYRFGTRFEFWSVGVKHGEEGKTVIVSQGTVGQHREEKEVAVAPNSTVLNTVRDEFEKKLRQGYAPVDEKAKIDFDIICQAEDVKAFPGYSEDECYHDELYYRLEDLFWLTGVGETVDFSTGIERNDDGTASYNDSLPIQISCSVVDFEIAKELIEKELAGTEFQNFEIRMVEKEK